MKSVKQIERIYYVSLLLFWLAISLPLALFILLIQARGMSLFQIGLIMGFYSLTVVLLEIPTGGLADAVGRKRIAILAYSFLLLGGVIFLGAFSFPVILLAFILKGVGRALSSGALDAWFIDSLQAIDPEIELQPVLAKANTFTLLALGVGTLGGSALPGFFQYLPAEGTAIFTPLSIPYLVSIFIFPMLLALVIFGVKETSPSGRASGWQQGVRQMPAMLKTAFSLSRKNPIILLLMGATFASGLALAGLESFWQPHFAGLLNGKIENTLFFGVVMGGNFLVGMAGNMLATPLSRLLKKQYALVCAIFQGIRGLMLIVLALQSTAPIAMLLFWLVYLNMGVVNSPHSTLLNKQVPAEHRSSMLSIESLASYLGGFIGGAGLGFVADRTSISASWIIAGVLLVVSLILYLQVDMKLRTQTKGADCGQENPLFEAG